MKYKILGILMTLLAVFIFVDPTLASAEKTVVIDPGHGGKYSGTCGLTGNTTGYCEERANLDVALKVKSILANKGINVKLTRETDVHFSSYLSGTDGDLGYADEEG